MTLVDIAGGLAHMHNSAIVLKYFCLAACLMRATIPAAANIRAHHSPLTSYERQIVASVIILEAASDGIDGMQAVLNVVYNRADRNIYRLVRAAVSKGSFYSMRSVWGMVNPDYSPILRRAQLDPFYTDAVKLVMMLERDELPDTTDGATHYYVTSEIPPYWIEDMYYRTTIGNHHFFATYPHKSIETEASIPE